ncbi:Tumor-specific antigen, partial [Globisporangium splendens]
MAPRFAFHASKFRNIECKQLPREQSYDGLQVSSALIEGNAVAATVDKFAFAHQMDGGGAIQVKALTETGKSASMTVKNERHPLLWDTTWLCVVVTNIWQLPANEPLTADLTTPVATFADARSSVGSVKFHPSAQGIVAFYAHKELWIGDIETQTSCFQVSFPEDTAALKDNICSLAWSYDGSLLLTTALDKRVRLVDPRVSATSSSLLHAETHTGRRPSSVTWCGRLEHFVTVGSDNMQERELKLWDPRNLSKYVARQRLDSSIGAMFPLFDDDVNLLYLLGKGDRSVRSFEIDGANARGGGLAVHALDHSVLSNMTFAAAMLPKQACDTSKCEVARILNLSTSSGGVCDVLSFQVPRKDAINAFQSDLYPDTKALTPALTSSSWKNGNNAPPTLERVSPTSAKASVDSGVSAVFGAPSPWKPAASVSSGSGNATTWGSAWSSANLAAATPAASTPASMPPATAIATAPSGWGTSAPASWNAPPPAPSSTSSVPAWKATVAAPKSQPVQWQAAVSVSAEQPNDAAEGEESGDMLSEKARRLGSKYGHKFKYIKGKQTTRNELFHFGDKSVASSTIASPILKANANFWAVPITGAGGPVMVNHLTAAGRASMETPILNGHKYAVTDMDFSPFDDDRNLLATGGGDSVIQIWSLRENDVKSSAAAPVQTLTGHTKALRTVQFHPTALNVLCSSAQDLSIRLWDVEYGKEQVTLTGKFDDMVWNMAFNDDGSLLATSSRDKIVRIFDPRRHDHALVAMGCGHDSGKPQFVAWINSSASSKILTIGVNARNEKQILFWDPRNLVDPISRPVTIESTSSSVVHYPLYDESSRLLFLVGMGNRHVQSYEIDPTSATAHANLPFTYAGQDPISGAALLPKRLCDVRNVEIDRMLLLTPRVVDHVSFSLPRAETLKQFFQDDVYGLVQTTKPSLAANEWFDGKNVTPARESLQPQGMVPLSEKPKDTVQVRPKTLDFQARLRQEDEEKRLKAEQFERLNTLAAQPSLHSINHGATKAPTTANEADSDDDWDD